MGGFIITGPEHKKVIVRGLGPSLAAAGIQGPLTHPTLELHDKNATLVSDDNWKDAQQTDIATTGIPPGNDLESAVVANLAPGAYTAVLAGKNQGTGVGLVELFDLSQDTNAQLANINTRGVVGTDNNVLIGGFNNDESAIVKVLAPGAYTAVVRGKTNTSGVGLVEVYFLK